MRFLNDHDARLPMMFQNGQNDLSISRLSQYLFSDSIRVEAESESGAQHLTVFDVTYIAPSYSSTPPSDVAAELVTLEEYKKNLDSRIDILDKQQAVLRKYSDNIQPVGSGGGVFGPDVLERFLDVYSTRQTAIDEQLVALRKDLKETNQKINGLNQRSQVASAGKRLPGVNIVMLANEDSAASVVISYRTLVIPLICLPRSKCRS